MQLSRLSKVLGGRQVLHATLRSPMDLIDLSKKGVSKAALNHLIKYTSLSAGVMASLLPITERTIQRYSTDDCFSPAVSEQIIAIAHIVSRGEEVFGDKHQFLAWMNSKNPVFSNKKPFELLSSRFGTDMINDELGRIEHGVIS